MPIRTTVTFTPDLTRPETVIGWVYLPIHVLALPLLMGFLPFLFPTVDISASQATGYYYLIGIIVVMLFFRKFLRREFDHLCDTPLSFLYGVIAGYMLWYVLNYFAQIIFLFLGWFQDTNPNEGALNELSKQDFRIMKAVTVFAAPILEEVLFRGVVFQSIRKKHRILAYAVSILLFSLYHVWQYALADLDPSMLLYAIQYFPITFALIWSYERSGTLWAPIALHMFNNYLAFTYMQMAG